MGHGALWWYPNTGPQVPRNLSHSLIFTLINWKQTATDFIHLRWRIMRAFIMCVRRRGDELVLMCAYFCFRAKRAARLGNPDVLLTTLPVCGPRYIPAGQRPLDVNLQPYTHTPGCLPDCWLREFCVCCACEVDCRACVSFVSDFAHISSRSPRVGQDLWLFCFSNSM